MNVRRNGGSRGGVIIALCLALGGAVAAAFAACASGETDGGSTEAPDSASPNDPDVKHVTTDTGASHPGTDSGTSDPDTGDPGEPDVSVPDDVNVPVDAGQDVAATDSGGGTCGGLAEWFAGTTATHVKHFGEKYTCIVSGWCSDPATNSVAAYEPGKGWAWTQAWNDDGACP